LAAAFLLAQLWAVLRRYGREGLQARIREAVRLAEVSKAWCATSRWEICAPRAVSVVCFRRPGSEEDNERLLTRVNDSGALFISHTRLNGRYVLRLAIGNERTTESDVRRAWAVLKRESALAGPLSGLNSLT
jgi:aromatic-L-amino-acid decarboxylase